MKKPEEAKKRNDRVSLYDLETPAIRKGISGWKLTKRPAAEGELSQGPLLFPAPLTHQESQVLKKKSKKRKGVAGREEVTIDGRRIQVGGSNFIEGEDMDSA